jgi:tetratricopeptide (TPR) repeat protein
VLSGLEEAIRVGVLEERSRLGAVSYRFAHAFFRQTLYEEMIAPRRLRLHQEIARALEAEYGSRREDHAAELAEHFANSTDKADLAKAVEYGEVAAKRAMSVFDYGEAVRLLERAIAVLEVLDAEDKEKRCDLLVSLGEALMPAGESQRAYEQVAEEALVLATALGDEVRSVSICLLATNALIRHGGRAWTPSTLLFQRWASLADRLASPMTHSRVHADINLGMIALAQGNPPEAWSMLQQALSLARRLQDREATFLAAAQILMPPYTAAGELEKIDLAMELFSGDRSGVSARTLASVLWACGAVFLASGELAKAKEAWLARNEIIERTQDRELLLLRPSSDACLAFVEGRLDDALVAADAIEASAGDFGYSADAAQLAAAAWADRPLLYLGRAEEVIRGVSRRMEISGGSAAARVIPLAVEAIALGYLDRHEECRAILRRALSDYSLDQESETVWLVNSLIFVFEAAVISQDSWAVEQLLNRLTQLASQSVSFGNSGRGLTCPARLLGAGAALLGKADDARRYYDQALEACERAEALDHLDFAIGEFREMKMQPSLERALRHRGLLKA